jgi:hypothetical protein
MLPRGCAECRAEDFMFQTSAVVNPIANHFFPILKDGATGALQDNGQNFAY